MGDLITRGRGARRLLAALLLVAAGACGGSGASADGDGPEPSTTATAPDGAAVHPSGDLPAGRDGVVTSVTDGDTFRIGDERVRLIGVDTPEISGPVECYGREAATALERLVPVGSRVRLVTDVTPVDRYGRTLAYVYRPGDATMVNLALVRDGFAVPLTVPPNVAHEDLFARAASEASSAGRGLWSACEDGADGTDGSAGASGGPGRPSTTAGGATGADGGGADGCEPAYPDVCIPPAPPDLDCGDIPHRRFTVLPPDPHRFDGDGNGLGCEAP